MTDLAARDRAHLWHPFTQAATAPPPLTIASASGAWLVGGDGRRYLDLVSSWWVNLHGHSHPRIAEAVAAQARTLEHVIFADFTHAPAVELGERLAAQLPGDLGRVFFSDNGSTAVEVAMKIAHQYWRNRGETRGQYVAFEGGYHGDTVGAMSAGRSSGFFRAWEDMLFPVHFAPYPETWEGDTLVDQHEAASLAALERVFDAHEGAIAAVIIEPLLQGASGMRASRPQFLAALAALVRRRGSLLILDEVMTGFGRTGSLFACQQAGVTPDLMCLSKGLTGGFLPMGLTVARETLYEAFLGADTDTAFLHGHSYTANPLGCAAGLASLDLLLSPECQAARTMIEATHRRLLPRLAERVPLARCRVVGTVAAFELDMGGTYDSSRGRDIKRRMLERGLVLRPLGNVLYLLPPYCVTAEELEMAYNGIAEVLAGV